MKHIPLILFLVIVFLFIRKRFFDKTDYESMIKNGGVIVDVRSEPEFFSGNIDNSINIPLGEISSNLNKLQDKNQPIITCCASGLRSEAAKKILTSKGYNNVVNGGGWSVLEKKILK